MRTSPMARLASLGGAPSFGLALLLSAPMALVPAPAAAQDDDDEDLLDEDEEDLEEADTPSGPASEEAADPGEGETAAETPADAPQPAEPAFEDVQTQYVIQGRARLLANSFEIAPQLLQSVNDRFVSHTGVMLSGLYNIKENIAVEVSGGTFACWDPQDFEDFTQGAVGINTAPRLGGCNTDATLELEENERLQPELVKLFRLTWILAADVQWSPIYGKVSFHDFVLGQFSLYLSVGAGFAGLYSDKADQLSNPLDTFIGVDPDTGASYLGPIQLTTSIGAGVRFYFLDWLGVRLEVRDYVQPLALLVSQELTAPQSTFEVRNTLLVQAGLTFVIPAPWK